MPDIFIRVGYSFSDPPHPKTHKSGLRAQAFAQSLWSFEKLKLEKFLVLVLELKKDPP